jgi:hypothetical protein
MACRLWTTFDRFGVVDGGCEEFQSGVAGRRESKTPRWAGALIDGWSAG